MAIDMQNKDYVVCPCRKVTTGEVEDIIKKENITKLKDLCEIANVGNKCGGCREDLDSILTAVNEK